MSHWKKRGKKEVKTLVDLSGTVEYKVDVTNPPTIVSVQFNRMGQVHDIAPREIETEKYIYPLFDDLHGRTRLAVDQYFDEII